MEYGGVGSQKQLIKCLLVLNGFIFCIAFLSDIQRITYKAYLLVKNSYLILFHNKMTEYSHSGIKHSSLALILIVETSPISNKIIMNRHFLPNDIC